MPQQPAAEKTMPPCGCKGGPCYWKPEVIKVPGFVDMELYYSHKGPRIRFKDYDDYAHGLDRSFVAAIIAQSAAFAAVVEALGAFTCAMCLRKIKSPPAPEIMECPNCATARAALAQAAKGEL